MQRLPRRLRISTRITRRRRGIGVADPLEIGEAVEIEVLLVGKTSVRDHARDHVKVEAVIRQVELKEPMDSAVFWRLAVVGPPDRIEAGPSPAAVEEGERA
jgi:hypothetical protein